MGGVVFSWFIKGHHQNQTIWWDNPTVCLANFCFDKVPWPWFPTTKTKQTHSLWSASNEYSFYHDVISLPWYTGTGIPVHYYGTAMLQCMVPHCLRFLTSWRCIICVQGKGSGCMLWLIGGCGVSCGQPRR